MPCSERSLRILECMKGEIMKPKEILWVLFLAIAALILNGKPTWSQSVGGTQSERSGGDSQTPLP